MTTEDLHRTCDALHAEVARLTRERDEARRWHGVTERDRVEALSERDEARAEVRAVNLGAEDMRRKLDALRAWEAEARAAVEAVRNGALRAEDYDRLSAVLGGKP
jgi:uncharacterized coiled-coil DUF342 family protein